MVASLGYHERLWNDVPCTIDELARVMAYVSDIDVNNSAGDKPCPSTWKCAPANEIDPSETVPLRFRVMVNPHKRVAFLAFRCTDETKIPDVHLDLQIINESWCKEQIAKALPRFFAGIAITKIVPAQWQSGLLQEGLEQVMAMCGERGMCEMAGNFEWLAGRVSLLQEVFEQIKAANGGQRICEAVRKLEQLWGQVEDPFGSVERAQAYVRDRVQPWASRNDYTVVVGGYSLGGFSAQLIGYNLNLHNVSFDGLWGLAKYLPRPLIFERLYKSASLFFHRNSVVNWSNSHIGYKYLVTPDETTVNQFSKGGMGYVGHNIAYFYDYTNPAQYTPFILTEDISAMYYVDPSTVEASSLRDLHHAEEYFRRNGISSLDSHCFFRVTPNFRNAVYEQMYLSKRGQYGDVWELGMNCFRQMHGYTSTAEERAQAIHAVLRAQWRRARGL